MELPIITDVRLLHLLKAPYPIDVTELGYDKVLAKGKITKAYKISAPQFSATAIEKIEELGGEAILL